MNEMNQAVEDVLTRDVCLCARPDAPILQSLMTKTSITESLFQRNESRSADGRQESTEVRSRPLRVLHVINVETLNYFLNNLVDYTARESLQFSAVTFGSEGSFVDELRRRGVTAYALKALSRTNYFRAARELSKI